ncbi:hypothetical protein, partial [Neisseria gonorrhoeae]|uniref:hypothetical protein n=1 Tax=Neisseria gonorrhoeae TaxID=485 RepID=UPI001E522677
GRICRLDKQGPPCSQPLENIVPKKKNGGGLFATKRIPSGTQTGADGSGQATAAAESAPDIRP